MPVLEAVAGLAVTVILTVAGWVWKLSTRLAAADGRITAGETLAAGASARAVELTRDLASHKEHVAAEYVSRDALDGLPRQSIRWRIASIIIFLHSMPRPGDRA